MKLLAVRNPWAHLIATGKKTMELRTKSTNYRGDFALYASRTTPHKEDLTYVDNVLGLDMHPVCYEYGYILAVVELVDCVALDTFDKYYSYHRQHCGSVFGFDSKLYGWQLDNIRPLRELVSFKMPKGAVVWTKIPDGRVKGVLTT